VSIDLIAAFVAVGFLSFLFGLFYAALIEARDKRWMAKHLRTRSADAERAAQQPTGTPAGVRH
jgi:hypothetical protein